MPLAKSTRFTQLIGTGITYLYLLIVLCSCNNQTGEEIPVPPKSTPVTFAADVDTRGTAVTSITQMGVFAYYTEQEAFADGSEFIPNFMYNQEVTKEENLWQYYPLKYWPNTTGDRLSFFAYTPHTDNCDALEVISKNSDTGFPQIRYTLPALVFEQVDLLTASSTDLTYTTEGVKFTMNHALTKIRFSAKRAKDYDGFLDSLIVTQITLKGGFKSGIATLTSNGVQWTIPNDAPDMRCVLTPMTGLKTIKLTDTEHYSLTGDGYELMLIPQALDDIVLEVTMDVSTASGNFIKSTTFPLKELIDWLPGGAINYQFMLDWNSISELTANTSNWTWSPTTPTNGEQTIE